MGLGSSPLKRRHSLRELDSWKFESRVRDSKKRSSASGARKLITDSMPIAMDWPGEHLSEICGSAASFSWALAFGKGNSLSVPSQESSQPCGAGPREKRLVRMKFGEVPPSIVSAPMRPSRKSSTSCGEEDVTVK